MPGLCQIMLETGLPTKRALSADGYGTATTLKEVGRGDTCDTRVECGTATYVWIMYGLCFDYVWIMHGLCLGYAWTMPGLFMDYAWIMY